MARYFLTLFCLTAFPAVSWAQTPAPIDPGAVQQHSSETRDYFNLEDQLNRANSSSKADPLTNRLAPNTSRQNGSTGQTTFLLKAVETNPSSVLTPAQLSSITARYEGREVTLQDLNKIVTDFNSFYKSHGYITALAILPPQKVVNGRVRIQLVEARLGKVVIKDNRYTRASYFTDRLPIAPGDLLQLQQIEKSLTYFNATNDVKVRAVLQAGQEFGTTDLVLDVQPTAAETTSFSFDNAGLGSTGRQRVGSTETISSLFGYRDPLSVGGYWSDGMWAGFASYNFPLTSDGLRLGPEVSYDNIRVRQSQLQKLGVNGTFYDLSTRLTRPVAVRGRFIMNAYIAPHFQESTLQSQKYQVSNIAVRTLELGASLQSSDSHGFWAGNLSVSGGDYSLLGLDAFLKFGGTATRMQNMGKGFVGVFRTQGQGKAADPRPLPPSQQFQIGGLSTVRGYPEGTLINDNGYSLSAELDTPVPFGHKQIFGASLGQRFRTAWFVDHGGVIAGSHTTYLTGTGGGLLVSLSRYLEGRIYLATPLESRSQFNSLAIHFAVEANPSFPAIFKMLWPGRE